MLFEEWSPMSIDLQHKEQGSRAAGLKNLIDHQLCHAAERVVCEIYFHKLLIPVIKEVPRS